jgi:hypothetical protein
MTAAVYRNGTAPLSVPQTQNTAPVLEFNCLYTHDIKRKQKRWQDGFLRFHTFNKRIMVYDIPRNFIGDAHWKSHAPVQDGDELTLDGIIVQVAESVGVTETDLTELHNSRKKGCSSEHASSSPLRPVSGTLQVRNTALQPVTQSKHRSLNALLGPSRGSLGKAVLPTRSPFEERNAGVENVPWDGGRAKKRRRIEEPSNVFRTGGSAPSLKRVGIQSPRPPMQHSRPSPGPLEEREAINLDGDHEETNRFLPGFSSDALMPPSSPKVDLPNDKHKSSSPVRKHSRNQPGKSMQYIDPGAVTGSANDNRHVQADTLEPAPTNSMNVLGGQANVGNTSTGHQYKQQVEIDEPARSNRNQAGGTLRMSSNATNKKKKTLLCHGQVVPQTDEDRTRPIAPSGIHRDIVANDDHPSQRASSRRLQDRLARIEAKEQKALQRVGNNLGQEKVVSRTSEQARHGTDLANDRAAALHYENETTLPNFDEAVMPRPLIADKPFSNPTHPRDDSRLRRAVSDPDTRKKKPLGRVPGEPIRIIPSPGKKRRKPDSRTGQTDRASTTSRDLTSLPSRSKAKKPLQRAVSLNISSNGTSAVIFSKPFHTPISTNEMLPPPPPPPKDPEPWSREAFDLFSWRPPGWDEEKWSIDVGDEGTEAGKG